MRLGLAPTALVLALAAQPAEAKHSAPAFIVANPSGFARSDAIIDLRVPAGKGPWSVRVRGRLAETQRVGAALRFVTDLAPKERLKVALVRGKAPAGPVRVRVTLNVREGDAGSRYTLRQHYAVPASHTGTDGLIAFEGIGWESDRVGYRIYLDGRNVVDLFGKLKPDIVYRSIGQGLDDYQYPRAWGGDIFKVGASLGVGGIGLLRDGHPSQIGPATLTARMAGDGPVTAIAAVDADRIAGGPGFIHARYALSAGTALTEATIDAGALAEPLVSGLTVHPGDQTLLSEPGAGRWAYIAVWGAQEHGPDEVGWALFYRIADVAAPPAQDGANLYIRFASGRHANYRFAGRWTQENRLVSGYRPVADPAAFRAWLEQQRDALDNPVRVARVR